MKIINRLLFSTILFAIFANTSFAQETEAEFKPNGKVHFKVFWNYHYDFSSNVEKISAFELTRSYFGYKYAFSEKISSKITLDVAKMMVVARIPHF